MAGTQTKLSIGVVGIGRMGQRHALNILYRLPRMRLVCVCSPAEHEIEWANEKLEPEGVLLFRDYSEMIRTPGLQAVVIASPTDLHIKHTLEAIDLGIHVLCEKPVTTDLTLLSSLLEKLEEKKRLSSSPPKVMVGFVRRFDSSYQDAYQKIKAGTIGTPIVVRAQGTEKLDRSGFFVEYARRSGGIFIDTVIHEIDLTLFLLGENIRPKALWATGIVSHHHEMNDFQNKDADNAVGVVQFWDGKIAYFYHSRTTSHGYDNGMDIIGTEGKICVNLVPANNRVQVYSSAGMTREAFPSWIDQFCEAFVTELEQFADAILDGRELPLKLSSAYSSLKLATALQESLITGERIEFDEQGNRK